MFFKDLARIHSEERAYEALGRSLAGVFVPAEDEAMLRIVDKTGRRDSGVPKPSLYGEYCGRKNLPRRIESDAT